MHPTVMGCCDEEVRPLPPETRSHSVLHKAALQLHRQTGELYSDPNFPAGGPGLPGRHSGDTAVVWQRPGEILAARAGVSREQVKPRLEVDNTDRGDIIQGELGDCWFLAPLSALADTRRYYKRVVPSGQAMPAVTRPDI